MSVLFVLMMASLGVAIVFLLAFLWSVRAGQFDDTGTPPMRVLGEEDSIPSQSTRREQP
ncbi:MAG: cbb3-type cytochrome oxidase assembly protein CcoS [Kiritimatiellae bacterium]|nr:cbb3-type cytochrome oxidase assembly protein CcoS [Kiritimatiellia bacterium]MDW8458323.1 cbb3-type cytochrome oxidase assembly protein CcoS [Verrucomicrobiota bacterium]